MILPSATSQAKTGASSSAPLTRFRGLLTSGATPPHTSQNAGVMPQSRHPTMRGQ